MSEPQLVPVDYSRRYTVEEYFALEARTGIRHEYFQGEIFPLEGPAASPELMAGASKRHNDIIFNCRLALEQRFGDSLCRAYAESVRTMVDEGRHFNYPDVVVSCDPQDSRDEMTVRHPTVIFEVLSDSTEGRDRGWKFQQYTRIASLQQLVLVSQRRIWVDSYVRNADDHTWTLTTLDELEAELVLSSLQMRIPLREIYRRIAISPLRLWRSTSEE